MMPGDKFDPELVQARWMLGGIRAEELPDQAVLALQQGFDGTALQQLAGLVRPTHRDLEALPEKAFAEMGLKPLDKDQAVAFLIAHGLPPTSGIMSVLLESFPAFWGRWKRHIADWSGEPAGSYNDIAEFVHFVVEDLYETDNTEEVHRVFRVLEELLAVADDETTGLIASFFEKLRNCASWRPYGNTVFEEFLGAKSRQLWEGIRRIWAGKSSLMDVLRAERER
jgi:hypothetical protein